MYSLFLVVTVALVRVCVPILSSGNFSSCSIGPARAPAVAIIPINPLNFSRFQSRFISFVSRRAKEFPCLSADDECIRRARNQTRWTLHGKNWNIPTKQDGRQPVGGTRGEPRYSGS